MTIIVVGLVVGFVALGVLLLSLNLRSDWHWSVKAVATIVVMAFFPINYFAIDSLLGWPTEHAFPRNFRLVASQVYEPNKKTNDPGVIYLWATDMKVKAGNSSPRAYRFEYREDFHRKVSLAESNQRRGIPQMGKVVEEDSEGLLAQVTDSSRRGFEGSQVEFYSLPGTILPEK